MRESSYNATLNAELESELGGRSIKLAEKVNLGIPDTLHIYKGFITFIEVKIGEDWRMEGELHVVKPWDSVNDLRQFEVSRNLSKHCLVMYVIYYPEIQMTAVLPFPIMDYFSPLRGTAASIELYEGSDFVRGHGIQRIIELIQDKRSKSVDT